MKPECVGHCWNTAADGECYYSHDEKPGSCPGYRPIIKANTKDMVNHPNHYAGQIEVIEYIRDKLTTTGFTEYCCGNVLKYISRWRKKDGIQDLKKARMYLNWMIESAKKESEPADPGDDKT